MNLWEIGHLEINSLQGHFPPEKKEKEGMTSPNTDLLSIIRDLVKFEPEIPKNEKDPRQLLLFGQLAYRYLGVGASAPL